MKRYMVFIGECYDANGGMHDFACDFDDLDEAKEKIKGISDDFEQWAHIYDQQSHKIIIDV